MKEFIIILLTITICMSVGRFREAWNDDTAKFDTRSMIQIIITGIVLVCILESEIIPI